MVTVDGIEYGTKEEAAARCPEGMTMELSKADRAKAANYLAVVHATGWRPKGMHSGTNWSTTVLLGYKLDTNQRPYRFVVNPESLPLIEGHPLLASIKVLTAQGYKVDTLRISRYRRWTINKGVPMIHTEDLRSAYVYLDGRARQYDNAEGRWVNEDLGNPGLILERERK